MRRFELREGTSSKFWAADVAGSKLTVCWGRIGTVGQAQTKTLETPERAQAEYQKLIGAGSAAKPKKEHPHCDTRVAAGSKDQSEAPARTQETAPGADCVVAQPRGVPWKAPA